MQFAAAIARIRITASHHNFLEMSESVVTTTSEENEDDEIEVQDVIIDRASNALKPLTSIWDDDKVQKLDYDDKGRRKWKCLWCNMEFAQWNTCKALSHVIKEGDNISKCTAVIDFEHQQHYLILNKKKETKKRTKMQGIQNVSDNIENHNAAAAVALENKRKKKKNDVAFCQKHPPPSGSTSTISSFFNKVAETSGAKESTPSTKGSGVQLLLPMSIPCASADSHLTMAISDLIHSRGLPFSLGSDAKFRKVLTLAKNASMTYKPPGRNQIATDLLDLNYTLYMGKNFEELMNDADIYGIAFFGDGATVKKAPLLNILASGVYKPAACMEIVDCAGHMEDGGKKDGKFIANQFRPYIEQCEAHTPNVVDLALFDGASNVQLAGQILSAHYPRISVVHGAEHVMSLFFNDLFKIPELQVFVKISRFVYKFFGSGSMHAPYAIFSKYSKQHNQGRKIGLIRAADTRMGGHVIALIRMLRLQTALKNTVTSREFLHLKV